MNTANRTFKAERARAWEYAEKFAPELQQAAFERKFEALKQSYLRSVENRMNGTARKKKSVFPVSYETGRFSKGCSGFGYFESRY